jgi:hypothetical protein
MFILKFKCLPACNFPGLDQTCSDGYCYSTNSTCPTGTTLMNETQCSCCNFDSSICNCTTNSSSLQVKKKCFFCDKRSYFSILISNFFFLIKISVIHQHLHVTQDRIKYVAMENVIPARFRAQIYWWEILHNWAIIHVWWATVGMEWIALCK